jgi:hypothetical protein
MSELMRFIPATMTIDITPPWWGASGADLFDDMSDVLRAIREMSAAKDEAPSTRLLGKVIDIVTGVHHVQLVTAVTADKQTSDIEAARDQILDKFVELAGGNARRVRQMAMKAAGAAERAARRRAAAQIEQLTPPSEPAAPAAA